MKDKNLVNLVVAALLASLVMVSTMFLKIPTVTGYVHLGDGVIFGASLALGPALGAATASVGSALADLLSGYAIWAPWTFFIKGGAGIIAGFFGRGRKKGGQLAALLAASVWIIAGYALGTAVIYKPASSAAVLGEVLGNVVQTASGVIIGLYLAPVLAKVAHPNN